MSVTNSVVICNGTNAPKKRAGDSFSKTLNPLAPEFVPKVLESTPPSSGGTTFAVPAFTLINRDYPPHLDPYPYPGLRQEPYQGIGLQVVHQGHHRQASSASYQGVHVAFQAPAATCGNEHYTRFGRNITREVMAALNNPSPPKPSTDRSQAPADPTSAGSQTS